MGGICMKPIMTSILAAALSIPALASAQFFRGENVCPFPMEALEFVNRHGTDPVTGNQICATTVSNEALLRASPIIAGDETALETAFRQLKRDAREGNTAAFAGDKMAVAAALTKLQSDRMTLRAAIDVNATIQAAIARVEADLRSIE